MVASVLDVAGITSIRFARPNSSTTHTVSPQRHEGYEGAGLLTLGDIHEFEVS